MECRTKSKGFYCAKIQMKKHTDRNSLKKEYVFINNKKSWCSIYLAAVQMGMILQSYTLFILLAS
jgi:hypothetical protein